jgi:hypothetical protein
MFASGADKSDRDVCPSVRPACPSVHRRSPDPQVSRQIMLVMNTDPTTNVVVFELGGLSADHAFGSAPADAEDSVRKAWDSVRRERRLRAEDVVALHSEWEPSPVDAFFIERTFPNATVSYSFPRPDPDRWPEALEDARQHLRDAEVQRLRTRMDEVEQNGELLPVLWSASSPQADLLGAVPHRTLVPRRLFVGLASVGIGPGGSIGVSHLTHHLLGGATFGQLYEKACATLRTGLRITGYDNGVLAVQRDGCLATAAVCLPDFHAEMSGLVGEDRFVVGIGCPDNLVIAAASSPQADGVRSLVLGSDHPAGELVPSLLLVEPTGISMLAERAA